jgi:hypothetical protein
VRLSTLSMAILLLAGPVGALAQDLDTSYQSLKDAEGKKDPALVKKLAVETGKLAQQVLDSPAPTAADEKDAWTKRVAYAKEVCTYAEYSLYTVALESPAATKVDLFSTLEELNPKSKYLDDGYQYYLQALNETGEAAKIPAIVDKAVANFPQNPDLLLVAATTAVTRKQADRALGYANRLVAAMNRQTKPEGISAADWERRRSIMLGRGYYFAGIINAEKGVYKAADTNLRAALPYIKSEPSMYGLALFDLGLANYNLGKMTNSKAKILEAAKFSEQAAQVDFPQQQQAWRNANVMKDEASRMR